MAVGGQVIRGHRFLIWRPPELSGLVPYRVPIRVEGTDSYCAFLARHVNTSIIRVVKFFRFHQQYFRRQGISDSLYSLSAALASHSRLSHFAPKGLYGSVYYIRALMVDRRSATAERTQTINQSRALIMTGPEDLRARFTKHTAAALVAGLASLRPRPGSTVGYATLYRAARAGTARGIPLRPARAHL